MRIHRRLKDRKTVRAGPCRTDANQYFQDMIGNCTNKLWRGHSPECSVTVKVEVNIPVRRRKTKRGRDEQTLDFAGAQLENPKFNLRFNSLKVILNHAC